ncbi:MAG: ABC transporter ATP-binding protein [Mycobacterium leprae]
MHPSLEVSFLDVFRQLKRFYWPHRLLWIGSISSMVVIATLQGLQPRVLGYLIDRAIIPGNWGLVLPLAGLIMLIAAVRSGFAFIQNTLGERFGIRSVHDLRRELYATLQRLPFAFYDNARTGDLMNRVTQDTEAIRHFLTWGPLGILGFAVTLLVGIIMGFSISWRLTTVTLVGSPVLLYMVLLFSRKNRQIWGKIRLTQSDLGAVLQEGINGIRTIKSYTREALQEGKVEVKSRAYADTQRGGASLWSVFYPLMELWANIIAVLTLILGGWMVMQGGITLGELVAYLSIQWQIMGPLWGVGGHINNLTNAQTAGERVLELINHHEGVKDLPTARDLPRLKGHVRFEEVSFAYDGERKVLEGIDLDAPPGSVIGIMGLTGSGKSTLVSLIPRFYDVTFGKVTVDGIDVRQATLGSLRPQVGVVFQETFLFSASVRENIAYGNSDATMEAIEAAARLAQAHEFIESLPEGYETVVGERGLGLSGGQKQRIAIARALLNDPRILVLDDATAAVDAETEQEIQAALRTAAKGRTTFVIAHRISAVRHADQILVMDGGRIVERGTHAELLARDGQYARIYAVQYADRQEVSVP